MPAPFQKRNNILPQKRSRKERKRIFSRKLSTAQAEEIIRLNLEKREKVNSLRKAHSAQAIANEYGLSVRTIYDIFRKVHWSDPEAKKRAGPAKITQKDALEIVRRHEYMLRQEKRLNDECSQKALALRFGISESTVNLIVSRRLWRNANVISS